MGTEDASDARSVPGRLTLFGHDPRDVTLRVLPRTRRWRLFGAGRILVVTLILAPVVGLAPPHVPWSLGVLGVGAFLAKRRWEERFTVVGIEGNCPNCDEELTVATGRLRHPHTVPCEACHHEGSVKVAEAELEEAAAGE